MSKIEMQKTVCGNQVQYDKSGVGHCWVNIDAEDIPASIREELEGEMMDAESKIQGDSDEWNIVTCSNGIKYRW